MDQEIRYLEFNCLMLSYHKFSCPSLKILDFPSFIEQMEKSKISPIKPKWFIFHFSIDIIPLLCVPFSTLHPKESWKTWKIWGRISNILGYCENISLKWWSSELAVDIIIEQLNAVMLMMQLQLSQVEVWKWIVGHKSSFGH